MVLIRCWIGWAAISRPVQASSIGGPRDEVNHQARREGASTHHGWKEFTFNDEPYFNNYFGKQGLSPNVSVICTSMLPPENPKQEIVGWCIDRPDGGRGAGIVMPHFYKSWLIDDLRIMILNSIVWCTKLEIPKSGVTTPKPNLASFGAQAIEPPAKKKA